MSIESVHCIQVLISEHNQCLPVDPPGQSNSALNIFVLINSIYFPSRFYTQTEHLYDPRLGFPPSLHSSSLFITFLLFFPIQLLTHTFSSFPLHHPIHHPSNSRVLAESCLHNSALPLLSLWPSQGSSNKTADIPPFFSLFFFFLNSPPAFLHLSELNVWNCRRSI